MKKNNLRKYVFLLKKDNSNNIKFSWKRYLYIGSLYRISKFSYFYTKLNRNFYKFLFSYHHVIMVFFKNFFLKKISFKNFFLKKIGFFFGRDYFTGIKPHQTEDLSRLIFTLQKTKLSRLKNFLCPTYSYHVGGVVYSAGLSNVFHKDEVIKKINHYNSFFFKGQVYNFLPKNSIFSNYNCYFYFNLSFCEDQGVVFLINYSDILKFYILHYCNNSLNI